MSCAAHSLHESRLSGADLEFRGHCRLADQFRGFLTRRIEEHRKVERFKGDDRGLWRFDVSLASEEGVDVAGGLLSVTDGRGHRSRAADQIAAGEDARMSSAHGCVDFDHITAADPNTWHGLEELDVRMLANG